jgi:hypothetical protein
MAVSLINVGNSANDGTGDDLREAMIKINQNFQTLDLVAEQVGQNLGSSGAEVYSDTADGVLKFRRLVAGNDINLTQYDNTIVVDAVVPDHTVIISGNTGSLLVQNDTSYSIVGAAGTTVSVNANTRTITVDGFNNNTNPVLAANFDGNNKNITNVGTISANYVIANDLNITTSANLADTQVTNFTSIGTLPNNISYHMRLGRYLDGFDMGELGVPAASILDVVIQQVGVDLGTFLVPADVDIDLGTLT